MKQGQDASTPPQWVAFASKYRSEKAAPEARQALAWRATLSRQGNFSVGCYCADEGHGHRSILRDLLLEHGASMETGEPDGH